MKGKNVELKKRVFAMFDKLNGSSMFKKLQFYFSKHQFEEADKLPFYQSQSQILDFTLSNFQLDLPLRKAEYSSRLFPLYNSQLKFNNHVNLGDPIAETNS